MFLPVGIDVISFELQWDRLPNVIWRRHISTPDTFRTVQPVLTDPKLAWLNATQFDESISMEKFQIIHYTGHVRKYRSYSQASWP